MTTPDVSSVHVLVYVFVQVCMSVCVCIHMGLYSRAHVAAKDQCLVFIALVFIFQRFIFIIHNYVCVSVGGYAHVSAGARGVQRHQIPWSWSYKWL